LPTQIAARIVQAKPGVPVGSLVAKGEVALGFQQLSEMLGVQGITIVGGLPKAVEIITTFSGSSGRHLPAARGHARPARLLAVRRLRCAQAPARHGPGLSLAISSATKRASARFLLLPRHA